MNRLERGGSPLIAAGGIFLAGCISDSPGYGGPQNPCAPHTATYNTDAGNELVCVDDGGMRVAPADSSGFPLSPDLVAADRAIFGDKATAAADLVAGAGPDLAVAADLAARPDLTPRPDLCVPPAPQCTTRPGQCGNPMCQGGLGTKVKECRPVGCDGTLGPAVTTCEC